MLLRILASPPSIRVSYSQGVSSDYSLRGELHLNYCGCISLLRQFLLLQLVRLMSPTGRLCVLSLSTGCGTHYRHLRRCSRVLHLPLLSNSACLTRALRALGRADILVSYIEHNCSPAMDLRLGNKVVSSLLVRHCD